LGVGNALAGVAVVALGALRTAGARVARFTARNDTVEAAIRELYELSGVTGVNAFALGAQ
jgi:phosphoribosylamine-glycine ligase